MTLIGDHPIGPTDGADTSCARRETLVPPTPGAYAGILVCELHSSNHRTREQMRVSLQHLRGGGKRGKEHDARQATLYRPQRGRLERIALQIYSTNHAKNGSGHAQRHRIGKRLLTARGKALRHRQEETWEGDPRRAPKRNAGTYPHALRIDTIWPTDTSKRSRASKRRTGKTSVSPHRPRRAD